MTLPEINSVHSGSKLKYRKESIYECFEKGRQWNRQHREKVARAHVMVTKGIATQHKDITKAKKITETKNKRREVAKHEAAPSHDHCLFAWPSDAGVEELEPSFELLSPSYPYFESAPFASF